MKNLWGKNFCVKDSVNTPQHIIQEQCDYLRNSTQGKIVAKIVEYDEPLEFYVSPLEGMVNTLKTLTSKEKGEVDIQNKLGETVESNFAFEFFITSTSTPNYKYRVMFINYGIEFYPVKIFLDEDIADEIHQEQCILCKTQEEFEEVLTQILNSNKLERIINNLLVIVKQSGVNA